MLHKNTKNGQHTALWLSLRFPQLPLDVLPATQQPLIITRGSKVHLACSRARASGIVPGTSVHTALLLSQPNADSDTDALIVRPYCAEQEQRSLQQLAQWAYQFTPYVSLWDEQHSLLLELSTCLALFGGIDALLHRIHQALAERQLTYCCGLAHTPKASWLLSWKIDCNSPATLKKSAKETPLCTEFFLDRVHQIELSDLPTAPPFTDKLLRQLHNVGLKKLGELLHLPRGSIAKRYGKRCLQQLDQITGQAPDLQNYILASIEFNDERHFLSGLESIAMLEQPMADLAQQFQEFLRIHQLQTEKFSWRFFHFDKTHSTVAVELSSPQSQAAVFLKLSQLKLNQHRINSPIETVSLHSDQLHRAKMNNRALFSEIGNHEPSGDSLLVDALTARLGKDCLYRLHAMDDHLPECRQSFKLATETIERDDIKATVAYPADALLPLWLLSAPQPLPKNRRKSMTLMNSGFRIDSHWWQRRQQRDYFIANDREGRHWIYFDQTQKRWFIHGHYG